MNKRLIAKIIGVMIIIAIFIFSLIPGSGKEDLFPHQDKVGHAFSYFLVTFWWNQIIEKFYHYRLLIGFTLMGVLIEFLQRATGYRTFDYFDMLANFTGCLIAYMLSTKLKIF